MSCKCQKRLDDFVIGNPEFVKVNALLEPDSDYVWELIDGFGNIYNQDFTTDGDGFGSIDMTQLPAGFTNTAQAPMTIRIKQTLSDCGYIPLVVAQSFLEISMSFKGGTGTKDWVACPLVPPETTYITTEEGDILTTEEGDLLIL